MVIKPIAEPCQDWGCIHNSGWDPDRESHRDLLKKPVKKHGSNGQLVCLSAQYHPIQEAAGKTEPTELSRGG